MFVVLGHHLERAWRQPHALAHGEALGDVFAVGIQLVGVEAILGVAEAVGDLGLADIVHERADAHVDHVGLLHAQRATDQHRDHAHVQRVRRRAVAAAGHEADADVVGHEHLVQDRAGQGFGGSSGILGPVADRIGRLAPGPRRLGVLALAALRGRALGHQLQLALLRGRGFGHARRQVGAGRGGGGCGLRQVALLGHPAQLLQAQPAQGRDLVRRRDAKTRQRKRMRQPAAFQVDEHADAQLFDGNGAEHGAPRSAGDGPGRPPDRLFSGAGCQFLSRRRREVAATAPA